MEILAGAAVRTLDIAKGGGVTSGIYRSVPPLININEEYNMKQINLGIIGTGWCGGIRAIAATANSPWVNELHIAEIKPERLKEVTEMTNPKSASTDYRPIIDDKSIDAVMISTTPEPTHYPIAKEALLAGKHVFLEKPIAMEMWGSRLN